MKKRRLVSGVSLCLLLTAAIPLSAGAVEETDFKFESTRGLYDLCSVQADDPNFLPAHWSCRGFLEGAVQYHDGVSDQEHLKRLICYPATATIADGKAAFVTWGKKNVDNTKYMNELPVIGVVRALGEKFTCAE